MNPILLTRQQVRDVDRHAIETLGIPALVLLENAGRGATELLIALGIHGPDLVCCGKGNNGGDGLVLARHLTLRRFPVRVLLFAQPADLTEEAKIHWDIVRRLNIAAEVAIDRSADDLAADFRRAEWIVDALFGTGLTRPIGPPLDRVVEAINASPARVLAIDIPSGLDADTGQALGPTVRAHHTATFVAPKIGFAQPAAAPWVGKVHVIDIGAPVYV